MKKLLLSFVLVSAFVFAFNSNAQIINPNPVYSTRGVMDITLNGASINYFVINDDNSKDFFSFNIGPFSYSSLYTRDINIAPSFGFFVIDRLRIGASIGFSFDYMSGINSSEDESRDSYIITFPISIQADYNLMINENNFIYFGLIGGGGIFYAANGSEDEGDTYDFVNIGPRVGWKWADNRIIIDLGLNYTFQSAGVLSSRDPYLDSKEDRTENHIVGLYLNIGGWFSLI